MKPTLGRIVLYILTAADADAINASRGDELTPQRGNHAAEGQIFPSMVVAVWGDGENPAVNLKVQLDGTDTYWATSRHESDEKSPGTWHWMEYQKQVAGIVTGPAVATGIAGSPTFSAPVTGVAGTALGEATGIAAIDSKVEETTTEETPPESTDPVELANAEGKPLEVADEPATDEAKAEAAV